MNMATASPRRIWLARGIAVAADAVQIALFPATVEGAVSPIVDGIDVVVALLLTFLVGWHIAFLPSIVIKLIPMADLAPTWTIAVFIATRGQTGRRNPVDSPAQLPRSDSSLGSINRDGGV
jgi:hypothetical protein